MAVTPFHVPFKTEYKPLGLENLMQPLSDIQSKFDATKLALEDATYNISRLSQDDPRGKELVKELKDKTDYIAEELGRTGNYRQAAIQLKKLNKSFTEDLETKAIVGNYENYKKAYEEQEKRVKEGQISQKDLETWDYQIKNTFGGTKYDPGTQKYTSINTRPPEQNREEELQKLSLQLAGMLVADEQDQIDNLGSTNGFDAALLKRTVKVRDLNSTTIEVANFLKNQPRFQDYILDKADREYFYNNHKVETAAANGADINPDQFKDQIYQGSLNKIKSQIEYVKKNGNNKEALQKLNNNLQEMQKEYQQSIADGTYSDFAEKLYKQDALGYLDRLAYTAADLVDYRSSSLNLDIKTTDPEGKAAAEESVKAMADIGTIPTTISSGLTSTLPKTVLGEGNVPSYSGTADPLNMTKVKMQNDFEAAAGKQTFELTKLDSEYASTQVKILRAADNFQNLFNGYQDKINSAPNEIAVINNKIAKSNNPAEKKELTAKKEEIANQLINNKLAFAATEQMVSNIIKESGAILFNTYGINPAIPSSTGKKQTANLQIAGITPNEMEGITVNAATRKELEKVFIDNGYDPKTLEATEKANPFNLLRALSLRSTEQMAEASRIAGKNATAADIQNYRNEASDPYTIMLGQVLKEYETNLRIDNPQVVNPLEVTVSDPLNKFSKGVSDEFKKEIIANTTGASPMPRAVISNSLTLANTSGDTNYDINAYEKDRPHLVGKDPNGHWIVRFNIKGEFAGDKSTSKGAVANYLSTGQGVNKDVAPKGSSFVSGAQVEEWKKNNPDNLYLNTGTSNLDLIQNTSNNYTKIVTNGIKLGTTEGQEAIRLATENFAPIWLVGDAKRRELYMAAAATINDGIANGEYKSFIEPPAVWNDLGNNKSEGFSINYEVKDRNVTAKIYKHIKDNNGNIIETDFVTAKDVKSQHNNLPTALLMLNMTYGTGRREDIPKGMAGFNDVDFVPGFFMKEGNTVTNSINNIIPVGTTIR